MSKDYERDCAHSKEGEPIHVPFQRTRRITGYLVGTVDRFCNAKAHEVKERVKHTGVYTCTTK